MKQKNIAEYHELHLQNDTLLLTDVFEKFRTMFLEIYEPDPAKFLSQPGMEWQAFYLLICKT